MGSRIHLQEEITFGTPIFHTSPAPIEPHSVVFEDDGDTGYFYARDGEAIVDALQIYAASDRSGTGSLQVAWTDDGLKAVAVIDRRPQAIFDFAARRGYSRSNFPQPTQGWSGHEWDDSAISLFR